MILYIFPNNTKDIYQIFMINTLSIFITFNPHRDEANHLYIKYPHIVSSHNSYIGAKMNAIIDDTIFNFIRNQNQDISSLEHSSCYIDYTLYYVDNKIISFSLENLQIMASAYITKQYFTISLDTGNTYQVDDFLGSNYQKDIRNYVLNTVKQRMKENHNDLYFIDKVISLIINEDQPFYINTEGKIVICFDKHQIAPGCNDTPKFIIETK